MKRYDKICVVCGKEYSAKAKNQKYCSLNCKVAGRPEAHKRTRFQIFKRDGFRCVYCGKSSIEDGVKLHADHIKPRVAGGKDTADNLVTACYCCNISKNAGRLDGETERRLVSLVRQRNKEYYLADNTLIDFSVGTPDEPFGNGNK